MPRTSSTWAPAGRRVTAVHRCPNPHRGFATPPRFAVAQGVASLRHRNTLRCDRIHSSAATRRWRPCAGVRGKGPLGFGRQTSRPLAGDQSLHRGDADHTLRSRASHPTQALVTSDGVDSERSPTQACQSLPAAQAIRQRKAPAGRQVRDSRARAAENRRTGTLESTRTSIVGASRALRGGPGGWVDSDQQSQRFRR